MVSDFFPFFVCLRRDLSGEKNNFPRLFTPKSVAMEGRIQHRRKANKTKNEIEGKHDGAR